MMAGRAGASPFRFSNPLFPHWIAMWQDWKNGVPPGREWRGRGAQNHLLLRVFGVLNAAEARANEEGRRGR